MVHTLVWPVAHAQWLLASIFGLLLVADLMFSNSNHFIFDPDLKNYARKSAAASQ